MSLNIDLIRASFEQAKPIGLGITEKFYEILFEDYPQAKALFNMDSMDKQKQQLLGSLVYIVDHVDNTDKLVPYLKSMGKRHVNYGVQNEHYDWVGGSLLKTFSFFFKEKWTDELNSLWTDTYGVIANVMKEGAAEN